MSAVKNIWALLMATLFFFAAGTAAAQEAPPLSAYGALPDLEDAAISPNGKNIAVLTTEGGERKLLFVNDQMQVVRQLEAGDLKIRSFRWVGNDRILLIIGTSANLSGSIAEAHEYNLAHIVPMNPREPNYVVFANEDKIFNGFRKNYGTRMVDGRWTVTFGVLELERHSTGTRISNYSFGDGRTRLYSVEAATGESTRVGKFSSVDEGRDWLLDENGAIAATLDITYEKGSWTLRGADKNVLVSGTQPDGQVGFVGLGNDGTTAIYWERDAENIIRWYEIPLSGGNPKEFLNKEDVERLYFDPVNGRIVGYLNPNKGPVFFDPAKQAIATKIREAFAGFDTRMMDWTPDFRQVLVRTSGNLDSGSWYLVDLETGQAKAFGFERMAIAPKHVGRISTVEFTARDGLKMDGILTVPPGREAKNLPLVMLPHGGPHSHDREQFDWWAQAFASRGYAVFQPNFRGSTNRDQSFEQAGWGEWGRKMQTDLSDGLAALADKGIVDPDRACIVGASYGGYAALAGVTIQQGVYRCAVAVAPVSDIRSMYNEDYRGSGRSRMTRARLLDRLGSRDSWDEVSPRRAAKLADAPIMLIHGVDDVVVPYTHSEKMADALKDAGKPYEFVRLEGEDHWLSLSATRQEMLRNAVTFVERHNPAD